MVTVGLFLRVLALVLFAMAAFGVSHPRLNFIAAGLFCWLLSAML